ncbi:MAG: peptidoglycan DD-metalloendopeptidase family protein [Leptolyngbyaceae bacterium]|nr:peptidoglycan DD-metalloendopeptidase family protein [Leptolyngbyaceae bacterium]
MALASIITPLGLLGSKIYSLRQKNAALTQENSALSETANDVIQELQSLDNEITTLRERAGLSEQAISDEGNEESNSRGGVAVRLETAELLAIAKERVPVLSARLYGQVKPALTETLDEEAARAAARPKGRPVKHNSEMSSGFGLRRNPFGWGYEFHDGLDFTGPLGTPIQSTAPGTVEKAEYQGGYGYHVVIDHGYGYKTLYAHLSEVSVEKGEVIIKDQVIGRLGSTGRSTGPHLHYSVYRNGTSVDPKDYLF